MELDEFTKKIGEEAIKEIELANDDIEDRESILTERVVFSFPIAEALGEYKFRDFLSIYHYCSVLLLIMSFVFFILSPTGILKITTVAAVIIFGFSTAFLWITAAMNLFDSKKEQKLLEEEEEDAPIMINEMPFFLSTANPYIVPGEQTRALWEDTSGPMLGILSCRLIKGRCYFSISDGEAIDLDDFDLAFSSWEDVWFFEEASTWVIDG